MFKKILFLFIIFFAFTSFAFAKDVDTDSDIIPVVALFAKNNMIKNQSFSDAFKNASQIVEYNSVDRLIKYFSIK